MSDTLIVLWTQVLRYNTGSAVRAFFGRQDQFWTLIHGQEGEGRLRRAPRKLGVPRNVGEKLAVSDSFAVANAAAN